MLCQKQQINGGLCVIPRWGKKKTKQNNYSNFDYYNALQK